MLYTKNITSNSKKKKDVSSLRAHNGEHLKITPYEHNFHSGVLKKKEKKTVHDTRGMRKIDTNSMGLYFG